LAARDIEDAVTGNTKIDFGSADMNETFKKNHGPLRPLWSSSKRLVARASDEFSCCELDDRRAECVADDRERCTLRLDSAERHRERRIQDQERA
jgi:hypothetical protein